MNQHRPRSVWSYLVMLPAVIAPLALVGTLTLYLFAADSQQSRLALLAGFALSELLMILTAGCGVVYLLTAEKNKLWLTVNILLFFAAGIAGVFTFLSM